MRLQNCRRAARVAAAVFVTPLALGACGNIIGVACTTNFVYGINATAVDGLTNASLTSGAYLVATEGSYKDSVGVNAGGQLVAAGERAGRYTVTVGHAGYVPFTQSPVVVNEDQCHPIPVTVQARLFRAPNPGGGPN